MAIHSLAQDMPTPTLSIGDPAPPLRVKAWIKGEQILHFEKGKIYIIEFWATWCIPCKAAMPHLSELARKYKTDITIAGIGIYEQEKNVLEKSKVFVEKMGYRMDYTVAIQDSNLVEKDWMEAAVESGIPKTFVVNREGRLAWIGYPKDLDQILPKIINNTWNITEALNDHTANKTLAWLDNKAYYDLVNYFHDLKKPDWPGNPDSALIAIQEIITMEPKLKYAPNIAFYTFSSLLKTNPYKAYQYGNEAINTPTYEEPVYSVITACMTINANNLLLPKELYQLGIEACQAQIDHVVYPEISNLSNLYKKMAEWYWHLGDTTNAVAAQQKAIKELKNKKAYSPMEIAELEIQLRQYGKIDIR